MTYLLFFYSLSSSFLSGFVRLMFTSPLVTLTSAPLWSPSITVANAPKPNNSPTAPHTLGSTTPVGGRKKEVIISPIDMMRQVQNAFFEMFSYNTFKDIFLFYENRKVTPKREVTFKIKNMTNIKKCFPCVSGYIFISLSYLNITKLQHNYL